MTPAERRKIWVEALRSGKYEQGTGYLCARGKHCCLGVACDLFASELTISVGFDRFDSEVVRYGNDPNFLPESVRDALGLRGRAGAYSNTSLANDNDHGKTFLEIADIIESEPEGLIVEGA
jgi:hypothetical protein